MRQAKQRAERVQRADEADITGMLVGRGRVDVIKSGERALCVYIAGYGDAGLTY